MLRRCQSRPTLTSFANLPSTKTCTVWMPPVGKVPLSGTPTQRASGDTNRVARPPENRDATPSAETLQPERPYVTPLRSATATSRLTLNGTDATSAIETVTPISLFLTFDSAADSTLPAAVA